MDVNLFIGIGMLALLVYLKLIEFHSLISINAVDPLF